MAARASCIFTGRLPLQWSRPQHSSCCTGIRIFCTQERSQLKNKERALSLLRSKLFEMETEKQRAEISAKRKSQVRRPTGCILGQATLLASSTSLHPTWYEAFKQVSGPT